MKGATTSSRLAHSPAPAPQKRIRELGGAVPCGRTSPTLQLAMWCRRNRILWVAYVVDVGQHKNTVIAMSRLPSRFQDEFRIVVAHFFRGDAHCGGGDAHGSLEFLVCRKGDAGRIGVVGMAINAGATKPDLRSRGAPNFQ